MPPVREARLLIGVHAAHSGSSSTYVRLGTVLDEFACPGSGDFHFAQAASAAKGGAPLQATIERQGRRAGLLGARFTPDPRSAELIVSVRTGTVDDPGIYQVGLSSIDAQAVLDGLRAVAHAPPVTELGAGRLEIGWAMTNIMDSSADGFRDLAGRLVPLLTLHPRSSADKVWQAWRRQAEAVRLATVLYHLNMLSLHRPEICNFRPGATEAEIESLERHLGLPLPEILRTILQRMNGGLFEDVTPASNEEREAPGRAHCELLSIADMDKAYIDLIATHEAYVELDGWKAQRPVRPRLRQPDGSCTRWPYLPIARTVEGRQLLVVMLDEPFASRVLDTFHELGLPDWGTLYDRYIDFMEEFVFSAGVVRCISNARL